MDLAEGASTAALDGGAAGAGDMDGAGGPGLVSDCGIRSGSIRGGVGVHRRMVTATTRRRVMAFMVPRIRDITGQMTIRLPLRNRTISTMKTMEEVPRTVIG